MKVAIIHDWLTGMRGGERVLEAICELYPEADIFTLVYKKGTVGGVIEEHPIYESFINRFPLAATKYRHYLPLFPTAIEKFDLRQYDLVISSSHCAAKGVITKPNTVHISYVHSPMRYVWDLYYDYFSKAQTNALTRTFIAVCANYLRTWDVASAQRIDLIIANSNFVAKRIKKYWGKEAIVINPPVDISRFKSVAHKSEYYLIVSALVPYKRIDIAVEAFNHNGLPLKIVGSGPEISRLQKLAKSNIEFLGSPSDKEVVNLYAKAKAFIFPGEEDFGITPLEAMASGTPVIAYGSGGALETVINGQTGIYFSQQTAQSLQGALDQLDSVTWSNEVMKQQATKFSKQHFKTQLRRSIAQAIKDHAA